MGGGQGNGVFHLEKNIFTHLFDSLSVCATLRNRKTKTQNLAQYLAHKNSIMLINLLL